MKLYRFLLVALLTHNHIAFASQSPNSKIWRAVTELMEYAVQNPNKEIISGPLDGSYGELSEQRIQTAQAASTRRPTEILIKGRAIIDRYEITADAQQRTLCVIAHAKITTQERPGCTSPQSQENNSAPQEIQYNYYTPCKTIRPQFDAKQATL